MEYKADLADLADVGRDRTMGGGVSRNRQAGMPAGIPPVVTAEEIAAKKAAKEAEEKLAETPKPDAKFLAWLPPPARALQVLPQNCHSTHHAVVTHQPHHHGQPLHPTTPL